MRKRDVKNKELLVLVLVVLIFVALLAVTGIYFRNRSAAANRVEPPPEDQLTIIKGSIGGGSGRDGSQDRQQEAVTLGSSAFFLKPGAEEVLSALKQAAPLHNGQLPKDMPPLKVIWPGYFFRLSQDETGRAILQMDTEENGFGVELSCLIDLKQYPEIGTLRQGQQLWVAGEVTSVDLEGTGAVAITVEYVRLDPPAAAQEALQTEQEQP